MSGDDDDSDYHRYDGDHLIIIMIIIINDDYNTFAIVRYLLPAQKGETPPETSMYAITPTPLFCIRGEDSQKVKVKVKK